MWIAHRRGLLTAVKVQTLDSDDIHIKSKLQKEESR
jgi:hypothetical protein